MVKIIYLKDIIINNNHNQINIINNLHKTNIINNSNLKIHIINQKNKKHIEDDWVIYNDDSKKNDIIVDEFIIPGNNSTQEISGNIINNNNIQKNENKKEDRKYYDSELDMKTSQLWRNDILINWKYYRKYLEYLIEGGIKPNKPNKNKAYDLLKINKSYNNSNKNKKVYS